MANIDALAPTGTFQGRSADVADGTRFLVASLTGIGCQYDIYADCDTESTAILVTRPASGSADGLTRWYKASHSFPLFTNDGKDDLFLIRVIQHALDLLVADIT